MTRGFLVLVLLLSSASVGEPHAWLEVPPARNWVAAGKNPEHSCLGGMNCPEFPPTCSNSNKAGCIEYNHYSLQAGGPALIKERSISEEHPKGVWPSPPYSHGLCGDPVQDRSSKKSHYIPWTEEQYLIPTPPQVTYKPGDVVAFKIGVHAHHMGFSEFRICDTGLDSKKLKSVQEGQDCLNKWVLKRAQPHLDCKPNDSRADCQPLDELHPGRWHWPNGRYDSQIQGFPDATNIVAGRDWNDSFVDERVQPYAGNYYTMRYVIPEDLSCDHCTLQWWWVSGNQCLYDQDVIKYMKRMEELGWQPFTRATAICHAENGAYGEEFWNCADIAVKGSATPAPTPAPTPKPTPGPASRRRRRSTRRRRRSARRRSTRRRSARRRRRRSTRRRRT